MTRTSAPVPDLRVLAHRMALRYPGGGADCARYLAALYAAAHPGRDDDALADDLDLLGAEFHRLASEKRQA